MKIKISKIEIIVFVGGSVVMILELIGSRILAPYLGTSIFVWSSLIGIILGALSLGYHLGGRFSLRDPSLKFLTGIIFLAGLTILFIPAMQEMVLVFAMGLGVKIGSVFATLILFTLPSVLLGMISPYAIRLKTQDVQSCGGAAGNLYAISTIGSIFGTFLAGFYLIPHFGSIQVLFGLSLVLLLTSLLGGFNKPKLFSFFVLILLFSVFVSLPSRYILETDSAYNHIRVAETVIPEFYGDNKVRILLLATEFHSLIYTDSDELAAKYHHLYKLDSLFKPEINKALTLGGGAYVAPINFLKRYPEAEMTVVEIDPKVTQVARDYFRLTDSPRLKIYHQDGRIFLNQTDQKYDVIYGDAFASFFSVPFQLATKQAMEKMNNALTDDGILVLNLISSLQGERSLFFQAEYKTLKETFPQLYIFPSRFYQDKDLDKRQNIVVIATKNPDRLTKDQLLKNASAEQIEFLEYFWDKEVIINPDIKTLTDNFAPVDYYISKLL